jgi:hypothetical protein
VTTDEEEGTTFIKAPCGGRTNRRAGHGVAKPRSERLAGPGAGGIGEEVGGSFDLS